MSSPSPYIARSLKEVKRIKKCIKFLGKKGYKLSHKRSLSSGSPSRLKFGRDKVRVFKGRKVLADDRSKSPVKKSSYKSALKRKTGTKVYIRSSSPSARKRSRKSRSRK